MLVSLKPELQKLLGSWQVPQQVLDAVAAACIANQDLAESLAKVRLWRGLHVDCTGGRLRGVGVRLGWGV
jgi:hypothetical protein